MARDATTDQVINDPDELAAAILAWEGFGPDDPESGRAKGEPRPVASKTLERHMRQADSEQSKAYREAYEQGRDEERRRSRSGGGGRRSGPAPRGRAGSSRHRITAHRLSRTASTAAAATTGTVTSWAGAGVGVLALIFLYFALTNAAGIARIIHIVVDGFTWLLDPYKSL